METENKYLERLKWFEDRIGKRVFRNKSTCKCSVCTSVEEKGLIIGDKMHAGYLMDMEGCSWGDGQIGIKYFDTIEEVNQFKDSL